MRWSWVRAVITSKELIPAIQQALIDKSAAELQKRAPSRKAVFWLGGETRIRDRSGGWRIL